MSDDRRRTISDLAAQQAPLSPRRAAAIALAVADELMHQPPFLLPDRLDAEHILVDGHGAISLEEHPAEVGHRDGVGRSRRKLDPDRHIPGRDGTEQLGADLGGIFFVLLIGRSARDSIDAFEPHLRSTLPSKLVAMLSRSFSSSPGQWPQLAEWVAPLEEFAGAVSPGPPPHRLRHLRRRRVTIAIALLALASVTAITLWLAPRWWDQATTDEGLGTTRGVSSHSGSPGTDQLTMS